MLKSKMKGIPNVECVFVRVLYLSHIVITKCLAQFRISRLTTVLLHLSLHLPYSIMIAELSILIDDI